jgi:hypothetical protein
MVSLTNYRGRRRASQLLRAGLVFLSMGAGFPGLWALFAPESFFRDFPGGGFAWVELLPPYNEHLVRDVGGFYLGFAVLLLVAAVMMDERVTRVALGAWLVATVPHFIFHLTHLDDFETADAIGQSIALGLGVVVPLFLLSIIRRARH